MGGKQKDRQEMQRLKFASRIWVQSVNLRDPLRRVGGDYGLKKTKKKTRSHGEVILPPTHTHTHKAGQQQWKAKAVNVQSGKRMN